MCVEGNEKDLNKHSYELAYIKNFASTTVILSFTVSAGPAIGFHWVFKNYMCSMSVERERSEVISGLLKISCEIEILHHNKRL